MISSAGIGWVAGCSEPLPDIALFDDVLGLLWVSCSACMPRSLVSRAGCSARRRVRDAGGASSSLDIGWAMDG